MFQLRLEIAVVPGAHDDRDRRTGEAMRPLPVGVEGADDGGDVAERRPRRVGVAAVDDDLDVCSLAGGEPAGEIRSDAHDDEGVAVVDQPGDVGRAVDGGDALEHAGAVEARQQVVRGGTAILVVHRVGRVVEVERRCVAEQERLQERRQEQDDAAARVTKQRQRFLPDQAANAENGGEHDVLTRDAWGSPGRRG